MVQLQHKNIMGYRNMTWQAKECDEKITRGSNGQLLRNGRPMSDAAIEQRLRRWCTKKKAGGLKCSQEVFNQYHNCGPEARMELVQAFKDSLLNKDHNYILCCDVAHWYHVSYLFVSFLPIPTTNCCLQDECQRTVKKKIVEETGKTLTVKAGWYTERQMKDVLKMPKLGSYFNSLVLSIY